MGDLNPRLQENAEGYKKTEVLPFVSGPKTPNAERPTV